MATETKTTTPAATTPEAKEKKAKRALRVPMPTNLQDAVAAEAKKVNKTPSIYIRDILAAQFKIEIPASTGGARKKYANKDERKAASKERRIKRAELVKALLAKHEAEQAAAAAAAAKK